MEGRFKVGDLVIRTAKYHFGSEVVKGGIYRVAGYGSNNHITIVGSDQEYDANKFELAKSQIVSNILNDL